MSDWIHRFHDQLGFFLAMAMRFFWSVFIGGTLFAILFLIMVKLTEDPFTILQLEAFEKNYQDFSLSRKGAGPQEPKDSNWDGAFSGIMIGFALRDLFPVAGPVIAPLYGATIGYQVDSRI